MGLLDKSFSVNSPLSQFLHFKKQIIGFQNKET